MVVACKPSKLSFGSLSPHLVPIRNPRKLHVSNRAVFDGPRWNLHHPVDAAASRFCPKRSDELMLKRPVRMEDEEEDEEEETEERNESNVHCEMEVVSWRERGIKAEIPVQADVKSVWSALTDYERLADFIPNLVSSKRIPCPYPGRIWLEQRGFERALYWQIEARVVLDLQESINSDFDRELHFSMVDGDFKKFEGKWSVKCGTRSSSSILSYEVNVIPRFNFPAIFLERIIRTDLPLNLRALACRAERISEENQNIVITEKSSVRSVDNSLYRKDNLLSLEFKDRLQASNFGSLSLTELNGSSWGMLGKSCSLDRQSIVDEVHLRRFDGLLENGGVHRFVVASITVKAPVCEVWNILTAYERLPEIVPNLAISRILSRENNKVRILQEGCKGLLYMVLHARVVLDLYEVHEQEIGFELVEGDFDYFQGKWLLEQLGNHHTLLKYTVESKMHKDTFLSEAIMEEVIYEDLPSNLCAIRDHVEKMVANQPSRERDQLIYTEDKNTQACTDCEGDSNSFSNEVSDCTRESSSRQRSRVPGLQRDIEILKAELLKFITENGQEGFMPMRKELRLHGRVDIEKAITRMGGFRRIASMMNLSLAYKNRKPKGFWDNLENLEEEISRFQMKWGMDPSFMPSRKTFERAGRYDIARALEKWGGLQEVSRLLSLKGRHPNRQARERKTVVETPTPLEDKTNTASNPYISQDTQKWISQLKHLDINWDD